MDASGSAAGVSVVRVAPLLAVFGAEGNRTIIIGRTLVVVDAQNTISLEASVAAAWKEEDGTRGSFDVVDLSRDDKLSNASALISSIMPFRKPLAEASSEDVAAGIAKDLCEKSRESVADIRDIRYFLEHELARSSAGDASDVDHTTIVASLLQLNIICGRTADEARETEREGLWVYITDPEAYHSYRVLQEPKIISCAEAATATTRTWMRMHDAAMRQCGAMRSLLESESIAIRSLISSATSISSSKEADAQSRFNVLAAIASIGLGLPALVLALYGANALVPITTMPRLAAFAPVIVALLVAAGLAIHQGIRTKRGNIWIFSAAGIVVFLIVLLVAAGLLAPETNL
ncbi:hypothetical protein SAMN06295943_2150 [Agreia sp. VKM Ac-1783]|nr:hypothetical protein SAMN06295943_2150 [Agreia sp. VKM Ac-1783]